MSASRPLDSSVISDKVVEVIDLTVDSLRDQDKERILSALQTSLRDYFEAYQANYPQKPSRPAFQPKVLAAISSYNTILRELVDMSIWRGQPELALTDLEVLLEQVDLQLAERLKPFRISGSSQYVLKGADVIRRLLQGEKIEDKEERAQLDGARLILQRRDDPALEKEFQVLVTALTNSEEIYVVRRLVGHQEKLETDQVYAERIESLIENALLTPEQLAKKRKEDRRKMLQKLDPKRSSMEEKSHPKPAAPNLAARKSLPAILSPSAHLPLMSPVALPQQELLSTQLLMDLRELTLKKYPDEQNPWHKAAMEIHHQADLLNTRFVNAHSEAELIVLQDSLTASMAVLANPSAKNYQALSSAIASCPDHSNVWLKLLGALTILAGLVLMALSAIGVLTGGTGIASVWTGTVLSSCGATMFYSGTQGPLANSLSNLADLSQDNNPRPS